MEVTFYSTHCPKCNVLKTKLNAKQISFNEINDANVMIAKGFSSVPMLEIDGKLLGFVEANNFLKTL
jgi:glutaredoxin